MRYELNLVGRTGLLMSNVQTADPLNPYTKALKELTAKRKKSEEDLIAIARIEWEGRLYTQNGRIVIPGENIEAAIIAGAKQFKMGRAVKGRILVFSDKKSVDPSVSPALEFGAKNGFVTGGIPNQSLNTIYQEFRDYRPVKNNGTATVMRCRPFFPKWSLRCAVEIHDSINLADFRQCLIAAGREGLCDYRPKYGQFDLEVL